MRRLWISILSITMISAAAPCPVRAAPDANKESAQTASATKDRARSLALTGFEEMQSGRTERAIDLFVEAERLYHAPTIVLLMAQAREKVGQIIEARAAYRSILEEDLPRSAPREFVDAKSEAKRGLDGLEGRFATVQVIVPGATADDVTLLIDGVEVAPFDAAHEQNPGSRRVTVKGRGGASVTQVLSLKAGDSERLMVPLGALDPYGPGSLFKPAVAAFGVGIVGLGAGAVMAGIAAKKSNDVDSRPASAFGAASAVSFAIGGASLATSAILLYMGRRESGAPSETTATLRASPGYLSIAGTF